MDAAVAGIGHNNPPELSPFAAIEAHIDDLFMEAENWLDGEPVTTQQQANALNTLETRIRQAAKTADDLRKAENKPFDEGKKAVQTKYNKLIGDTKTVTGKTVAALNALKRALEPFLLEQDRLQREAAAKALAEAEEAERIAKEAMQARDASNLASTQNAEQLVQEAEQAKAKAKQAKNTKAHAKGEVRATALRTVYRAQMVDNREAAKWAMNNNTPAFLEFIQNMADQAVRAGKRDIPGFNVIEEKVL